MNRILAGILPAIIVVLIAIPAWDYWQRADIARPGSQQPDEFPQDLAVRADGFQITRSEAGRKVWTVTAEVTLGTKDNRHFGRGVDIQIFPRRAGDPTRHIRADECSYDEPGGNIDCSSNVAVQFDESTLGYTEQLNYSNASQTITSDVRTKLEQPGEMTGDAGHVIYSIETGLLQLSDKVTIHLTSGATLRSGLATFHQKEQWAAVSQNVELLSPNGNIRGESGRAELEAGTYRPRLITVDGNVIAESGADRPNGSGEQPWTIQSQRLRGSLSAESHIEHVFAQGNAAARRMSESGEEVLTGGEIEAFMDREGHLSSVEARQAPVFVTSGRRLTAASRIVIGPNRKVTTTGASTLDAGNGTVIEGADFSIAQKEMARVFETNLRAVLTSRDASGDFRTEGDRTTAEFDAETNQLRRLVQSGKVAFAQKTQQGERSGRAQTMTVTNNGSNIGLEGAARIVDGGTQTTMDAQQITLDQNKKLIEGRGNVVVVDNRSRETPVRVTSGRVVAVGDTVEYHDQVKLHRGDANVDADHIHANSASSGFQAEGNVWFRAGGGFDARSHSLDFSGSPEKGQSATFRGNVLAYRRDRNGMMELKTATMRVLLKPGSNAALDSIEARGGVEIRQGNRSGEGVEADYSAATGQIILRGSTTLDAVARGSEGETRGFLIQTNPDGRWAAVQPSRVTGSVRTSTDKPKK